MAKPKARATNAAKPEAGATWLTIPSSWGLPALVLAPAEAAARWRGRDGDNVRIVYQGWKELFDKLPAELKPKRGHRDSPHITVASEAEAKTVIAKLLEVVQAHHPNATVKKKKSGTLLRFLTGESREDPSYNLVITPESAGDVAFETTSRDIEAWSWPVEGAEVLLWRAGRSNVKVRATADEIVFVHSSTIKKPDELAASITGKPTTHGTWSFNKLLVGMWISLAVKDLKGLEGTDVAALAARANTVIKPKQSEEGGAVVLPATGRFRAESGGTDAVKWLRFVRA